MEYMTPDEIIELFNIKSRADMEDKKEKPSKYKH